MIKFIFLLIFVNLTVFSYDYTKGDYCLYSFKASGSYDAELKIEIKDIVKNMTEDTLKLLIVQRNGTITVKKDVELSASLTKDNILESFLAITNKTTKRKIILKSKNIIEDYKFNFRNKKYLGYLIKANLEIDKKLYKVTYIFSKELPVLGLFRFTITQNVKSKKKYKFKNVMLIKECFSKGNILEL